MWITFLKYYAVAFLLFMAATVAVANETNSELSDLIERQDFQRAYQLATLMLDENEGNSEFDYLYALSAIETGHPGQAVFALERLVFAHPGDMHARLDLARVLFLIGDYESSRVQFKQVLAIGPPDNVREKIVLFLSEIDKKMAGNRLSLHGLVAVSVSADNNINSATSSESVTVPALGIIQLNDASIKEDDIQTGIKSMFIIERKRNKRSLLFAEISVDNKNNLKSDIFDTSLLSYQVGYKFVTRNYQVKLPFQYQGLQVNNESIRSIKNITVEMERLAHGSNYTPSFFMQAGQTRYLNQANRDMYYIVGGYGRSFSYSLKTRMSMMGFVGNELAVNAIGKHFGRIYYGIKSSLKRAVTTKNMAYSNIVVQASSYHDTYPAFDVVRTDYFAQLSLGWSYRHNKHIHYKSDLQYYINQSNISLFEYDRAAFIVSAEYIF